MVLGDSVDAMHACSVLLARCDDKAAWFEQGQERRHACGHLCGHVRGQVAVVHHGLCRPCVAPCVGCHSGGSNDGGGDSDARSRIVKVGDPMEMYDGDQARVYAANNAGASITVEALLVVGTALAMAEGTSGIGSAGRADKATIAAPEALGPRAYGGAGTSAGCAHGPAGAGRVCADCSFGQGV